MHLKVLPYHSPTQGWKFLTRVGLSFNARAAAVTNVPNWTGLPVSTKSYDISTKHCDFLSESYECWLTGTSFWLWSLPVLYSGARNQQWVFGRFSTVGRLINREVPLWAATACFEHMGVIIKIGTDFECILLHPLHYGEPYLNNSRLAARWLTFCL